MWATPAFPVIASIGRETSVMDERVSSMARRCGGTIELRDRADSFLAAIRKLGDASSWWRAGGVAQVPRSPGGNKASRSI